MIIAEDLLLLAFDDATGRPDRHVDNLDYRLAGALLVELALTGRVDVAEAGAVAPDGSARRRGTVVVRDASPTGHPALDRAIDVVGRRARKPKDLIGPLSKRIREPLLTGLVERGILQREDRRIMGIVPTTAWPAADSSHELRLRAECEAVLLGTQDPRPETAALLSVVHGTGLVKKLVPPGHAKAAKRRAKEITQQSWANDAVKKAVDDVNAAVMVAVMIPAMSAAAASG
ncbi:GOLPH3/VPS74 family protein [Isoptericola croceus]|uniref:GOLPH3/VPS74 family protein n=1 Tax=Isoptericola croceus TaxID=3031406 RepID=UPI0023F69A09|nr:GPP34 family phosphoprotein [Isoptericola croceus]